MSPVRTNIETDADRFWSRVDRSGDCWIWTGAKGAHGYGRIVIDQQAWNVRRLAWFLVMGELPRDSLYHVDVEQGARRYSRVRSGATKVVDCVRPQHLRDGRVDTSQSLWYAKAESGFPPEFRTDRLMGTEQAQTDLMPLLLYRGNLTVGRAQALFNFSMAAQAAEAERLGDVVALSKRWPDMDHAVGLHKPITAHSSIGRFWDRLIAHPVVTDQHPGMRDYIRGVMASSDWKPTRLDPIDRYSPWSTRDWRKTGRPTGSLYEPLTKVWPFIEGAANSDHDLVMAVDRAVSKRLPESIRQDVCQDLMLAVLEGEVGIADLAASSESYIKAVFRQYPTKYGPLSLDAPRGETERNYYETMADSPLILDGGFGSLADLRDRLLEAEQAVA